MTSEPFVLTSIARRLLSRMEATHDRQRISVFAGPPGIGKTTTIDAFQRRHPQEVAVVKLGRPNAREVLVLQHVLEALRYLQRLSTEHAPGGIWELRRAVFNTICRQFDADPIAARKGEIDFGTAQRLTVVFDEAQNLSRQVIEAMRYWNDADRCYAPFPIGLIFVGNNEFSLASQGGVDSVISAAVADRAFFSDTFEYDDVSDADLAMVLNAWGADNQIAIRATTQALRGHRVPRSFRQARMILETHHIAQRGAPPPEPPPQH